MKKIISLTIALIMAASLCGCGGGNAGNIGEAGISENNGTEKKTQSALMNDEDEYEKIDDSFNTGIELGETRNTLSPEEADFRNLKWGMTKDDVAYAEGNGYREPDDDTMYFTRVREEGFPCDAEYKFENGGLYQGEFYILENKESEPVSEDDYKELIESLKERFGEPQISDEVYKDEAETTNDPEIRYELIGENALQLRTGWTLSNTQLRVVFYGRQGVPCIGLQYKKI